MLRRCEKREGGRAIVWCSREMVLTELAALHEQIALELLCCWCGVSAVNGCLCSKSERLLSPLPRSQVLRDRLLTPAADVYALGVLLWQVGGQQW